MKLEFNYKIIWGRERFYPVNKAAIDLLKIFGQKTVTKEQIALMLSCGWNVKIKQDKFDLSIIRSKN